MRGEKYFLMLTLMVFSILGSIILMGKLPGFYFAIELYVIIFFMLLVSISIYCIRLNSSWGWRLGTVFFAANIINALYLFYLIPHPIIIIITVIASGGYIIALDHLNDGKLIFDNFNLEKIDFSKRLVESVVKGKTLGVLDEDRDLMKRKIEDAIARSKAVDHKEEDKQERNNVPVEAYYDNDDDLKRLREMSRKLSEEHPDVDLDKKYDDIIKKRDFTYYESDIDGLSAGAPVETSIETQAGPSVEASVESLGIEEVTIDSLDVDSTIDLTDNLAVEQVETKKTTKRKQYKYIASPFSSKFHTMECKWINRLNQKEAIKFENISQAIKEGFNPCKCVDKDIM
ncbi:hypothetical protein COV93_00600 [Candidatus Woesearchaeota archaeon CG11_big_fil_rev_8_21_14_0_20_43_8]|nr:MAG: hypothetical protein COV93_00600 [Candidatus Woesearchaeota archaeon CG11_big_fil_rev_8_21_14_0_20_43_8]PIO04689.1 MAG: hypothetical protein COT47_07920 [Candidatus Woesearchaeota archaeon CG08_land_8_20_14_0_20_43_7]